MKANIFNTGYILNYVLLNTFTKEIGIYCHVAI